MRHRSRSRYPTGCDGPSSLATSTVTRPSCAARCLFMSSIIGWPTKHAWQPLPLAGFCWRAPTSKADRLYLLRATARTRRLFLRTLRTSAIVSRMPTCPTPQSCASPTPGSSTGSALPSLTGMVKFPPSRSHRVVHRVLLRGRPGQLVLDSFVHRGANTSRTSRNPARHPLSGLTRSCCSALAMRRPRRHRRFPCSGRPLQVAHPRSRCSPAGTEAASPVDAQVVQEAVPTVARTAGQRRPSEAHPMDPRMGGARARAAQAHCRHTHEARARRRSCTATARRAGTCTGSSTSR